MSGSVTLRLSIGGLVQGVSYRWSMQMEAERLGLDGWVRNRRDGSVEAVASGPESDVQKLVDWAHRGPPAARVDRVDVSPSTEPVSPGFRQLPTV